MSKEEENKIEEEKNETSQNNSDENNPRESIEVTLSSNANSEEVPKIEIPEMDETTSFDPVSKTFFRKRNLPDDKRCVALMKNCECGYHYKKEDRYNEDGTEKPRPFYCPVCGRVRRRCRNPRIAGASCCRVHGGKGQLASRRKADTFPYRVDYKNLSEEDIPTHEALVEEDDITLKKEFHAMRMSFWKALKKYGEACEIQDEKGVGDIIGMAGQLSGIINQLSSLRGKINKSGFGGELDPENELKKLEFSDPRVKYLLKQTLYDQEVKTISKVLDVVLKSVGDNTAIKIVSKLPESFLPFVSEKYIEENEQENVIETD